MTNFRIAVGSFLLLAVILGACSEQSEILEKSITVQEVQSRFADITNRNPSGRQDLIDIAWEDANYREISIGDALVFPLENVTNSYVSDSEDGVLYPVYNTAYAFAYKGEQDNINLEYVQTISTANTAAFTGYITVSDWNEEVKHIFYYQNGVLDGSATNGREEACEEIYYFNCTDVHIDGELYSTHCEYSHSVLNCRTMGAPQVLDPDDYDTSGATLKPTGLCPHPSLEGVFVFCDDCETDVDGNCTSAAEIWNDDVCLTEAFSGNDCLTSVWNVLKDEDIAHTLLKGFIKENPEAKLCLDRKDIGDKVHGTTSYPKDGIITIKINSHIKEKEQTKLQRAKTMLHEMIHAELIRRIVKAGGYNQLQDFAANNPEKDDFDIIWEYYNTYDTYKKGVSKGWQHEYMANYYINSMTDAMMELLPKLSTERFISYNENPEVTMPDGKPFSWRGFCEALAWQGLHKTEAFAKKFDTEEKLDSWDNYLLIATQESSSQKCN